MAIIEVSGLSTFHVQDDMKPEIAYEIYAYIERQYDYFLNWLTTALEWNHVYKEYDICNLIMSCGRELIRFWLDKVEEPSDMYHYMSNLSKTKYEGECANGRLCITNNSDIIQSACTYRFTGSYKLSDKKTARKLLEISKEDIILVSDGLYLLGFTTYDNMIKVVDHIQREYKTKKIPKECRIFILEILDDHCWTISSYEAKSKLVSSVIMIEDDVPKIIYNEDYSVANTFNSIFSTGYNDYIKDIIDAAINQAHGTMLVFLDDANDEVNRLHTGFSIKFENEQKNITSIVSCITSIDGAVLLDKHGMIYSFGVILDGESSHKAIENSQRGARYNSAIKYSATIQQNCLIVVVSEDGYIDMIADGKCIS